MRGKKVLQLFMFSIPLLLIVFLLFNLYTTQNKERIMEQNKNYAEDSMRQKAKQVAGEMENGGRIINAYAYFFNDSLTDNLIPSQTLAEMERNSVFDTIRFTDAEGVTHLSDGRTVDSSDRDYYARGMQGESGISIIFDERLTDEETRLVFFAPVRMDGEIVGIIRGSYLAELYMKDILRTTYFGEPSTTWLCMPDGRVIAGSDDQEYGDENLIDLLQSRELIDANTAAGAKAVFENGGEGAFICEENSKTDNLCVTYLPDYDFVMVQLFPPSVTQKMIKGANVAGVRLETALIALFVIYFAFAIVRAAKQRKELESENHQINYVLQGLNTLFSSRYLTVDLETGVYAYIGGVNLVDTQMMQEGNYTNIVENHSREMIGEEAQENYREMFRIDSIRENLADQDTFTYECHVLRDGQEEWEQIITVCLERHEGKANKILYVRQNITEMKQRELRRSEEMSVMNRKERQYKIAITSNSFSTFELNLTRDLVEQDVISTRGEEPISLLEQVGLQAPCSASECLDRWEQFVLPESIEDYEKVVNVPYLLECFARGEAEIDIDYWGNAEEGGQMCVRQSFIMTRDDMTDDIIAMVVSRDITEQVIEQKEQTIALQDALMHARQANEAKTTFLSNMSHDIRTPMNAIIGFATIAASRIDNKDQVRECLQKVLSSSNHLLSLINDILDMSRIESGKMQIHEQECNISELMHNLVNIIQPQVKAKQLELFIDTFEVVNEDVITDPLKLNQIFINLMSNAVKYTPAGGMITFRIMQHTTFKHGYGDYVFIIKDNGIGMSEEFVKHVFEPFERETTTTRSGIQGTGLGMAITKNIVEMMNGTVTVESEVGKGSTFTVNLTLKLQDVEKNAAQIRELEGLRALVVDDDFNVCDSVSKMLKTIGMRSEWTTSGREAVYRAKIARDEGDSYHTYIIDWQMPETSGIETARKIRSAVGEESPIIILTAYDWSDIEEEAKEAGVTAFCAKPLFMSDLKSALLAANSMDHKEEPEEAVWKTTDFSGKRVLLVEDIELNREIAEVILTESGFEVESAPDGTDAVDMVKRSEENYYDVILMDVQMPIMNGYEATRTIRSLPRQDVKTLPIIAMTANALEEDKAAALKSGMNDHIAKPLDIELFIEVLSKHLRK
ncbi:MAG: response regulator [Lachnospiraceae bacterium]|nr:response regulator [Lachnospiraceae bacterium]